MIVKRYPHYTRYTSLIQNLLYVLLDYTGTGKWKPTNPLIKKEQRTRKSSGLNDHIWEKTSPLPPPPTSREKKNYMPYKTNNQPNPTETLWKQAAFVVFQSVVVHSSFSLFTLYVSLRKYRVQSCTEGGFINPFLVVYFNRLLKCVAVLQNFEWDQKQQLRVSRASCTHSGTTMTT